MYERIMVGIDDSPSSDKVLAAAIGLWWQGRSV